MTDTRLDALDRRGRRGLARRHLPPAAELRRPRRAPRPGRRRRHVEPHDLRQGALRRRHLRRAGARPARPRRLAGGGGPRHHRLRRALGLRRDDSPPTTPAAAATAGCRSRSTRGSRTTPSPTTAEARALWWLVDRPNVMIKIPATQEGLAAITAATAEGISVNVTLIFGLDRYDEVMDAFLTGLEHAQKNGIDLSTIQSVASFFVSRVDTEVDKRLDKIGTDEAEALKAQGGDRQRPARLPALRAGHRLRPLAGARAGRRQPAAAAVGVDVGQGPEPARHAVRHQPGRARHRQHDARGHHRRRSPTTASSQGDTVTRRLRRGAGRDRPTSTRSASATTTSSPCSSARASRSSRSRGPSCSTPSADGPRPAKAGSVTAWNTVQSPLGPDDAAGGGYELVVRLPRRGRRSPLLSSGWSTTRSRAGCRRRTPRCGARDAESEASQAARPGCRCTQTSRPLVAEIEQLRTELRGRGPRPRRAVRHGRVVAGARGHLRHRRRRAHRARLVRPRLRPRRAGRPARAHRGRRVQQVRRHGRDRQPAAGLRAGVPRRRPRPGRPPGRRHRSRLAAARAGRRGRLPRLHGRPRRRRPLLGADRVRPGTQRACRCRHRPAARRGRAASPRRWPTTTSTTPACGSVRCSACANEAGADKVVLADAETPIVGFGDWAEQLIAESTGKQGKGMLPVVVESTAATNFDPNTPDEVLVSIGSGFPFERRAAGVGSASPSTRRSAPRCCCGSTRSRSPAG